MAAVLFGSQLLTACGSDTNNVEPQIPLVTFSETLNVTNQQYTPLRADNGAIYHAGGVRGLIIVRQSANTYLAFERNCTYRVSDTCSRVRIDASRLFLKDPCCGSQFDLQGRVQSGPASRSLRQYTTSLSGNILSITN
jgi:nitrite reductase/ring-hydroxylating ferredoxin subunit